MTTKHTLVFLMMLIWINPVGYAAGKTYTPKIGSTERKQVINSIKKKIHLELRKPIKLKLDSFLIQNEWAFLRGTLVDNHGKPIDYSNTPYQDQINSGAFDDWFCVLLHKKNGIWSVVNHVIGATDVPYVDWAEKYHAPAELLK